MPGVRKCLVRERTVQTLSSLSLIAVGLGEGIVFQAGEQRGQKPRHQRENDTFEAHF